MTVDTEAVLAPHLIEPDAKDKSWSRALVCEIGPHILDLSTPVLTLDLAAVAHNITAMSDWASHHDVLLAPHGKTTMCPALWDWQLAAGAWGITVAGEAQLRVARAAGVGNVIVANEYLSPQGLAWLANELGVDDAFDVTCWVDSVDAVEQMSAALAAAGSRRPVGVCVEIGASSARTGARRAQDARATAEAAARSPFLELRGVAGYEGSVPGEAESAEKATNVVLFLREMVREFSALRDLVEVENPIITAGGSAYFDLVAEEFARVGAAEPAVRVIVRSGAYVVHDDGIYRRSTPSASRIGPTFVAAAHLWARVISVPEPNLAFLDVGKRDLAYDSGLPEIQRVYRGSGDGGFEERHASGTTIIATSDQHAHVRVDRPGALRVGDIVKLGQSHPCTMFDKWRSVVLLDEDQRARGVVATYF